MNPTYTCIFYMSEGIEEIWGSEFHMVITEDAVEAAARLAHFHYHNETTKNQRNIGSYDIHVLINGRDDKHATDEDLVYIEDIHRLVNENLTQLRRAAEAKKAIEAAKVEAIAAQKKLDVEQKERELLAILQKKYA